MKLRCFLAIPIPSFILFELEKLQRQLGALSHQVRWVNARGIHLTLKFLGEVEPAQVKDLSLTLPPVLQTLSAFDLLVCDLGVFPSARRPRVFWAGIKEANQAAPCLPNLVERIEQLAEACGIPREKNPFHPHLTLGRAKEQGFYDHLLEEIRNNGASFSAGTFIADRVILYQSTLQPSGPIYNPLQTFSFPK